MTISPTDHAIPKGSSPMNPASPLFDKIRIPARSTPAEIGARLCREAGFDVAEVRTGQLPTKGTKPGIFDLRCRIVCAMTDAGAYDPAIMAWFHGVQLGTIRRYRTEGRKMRAGQ